MSKKIASKYDPSKKVSIDFSKEISRTKQSFKDEADINNIVAKYNKTGQLPSLISQNPKYGDFTSDVSYQESLNTVMFANEQFNALSAKVKLRFNNDPMELLKFVSDAKNKDEMYELGLAIKPAPIVESAPNGDLLKEGLEKPSKKESVPAMDAN